MIDHQKQFEKAFNSLRQKYLPWDLWGDFVAMAAASLSNAVDIAHKPTREREYMHRASRYDRDELPVFGELLGITASALEFNPRQDFLGRIFMLLNLGDDAKGQVFTPYSVSEMNADMIIGETAKTTYRERGYVKIIDSAVGAGAMLIAARNRLQDIGIGTDGAWFVGQDISYIAAYMAYIQLSLLGCAGYICIGDSLINPTVCRGQFMPVEQDGNEIWMLPMTYTGAWPLRIKADYMEWVLEQITPVHTKEPEQLCLW